MVISVLAFLVAQQSSPPQLLPISARPEFQQTVFAIRSALKTGDNVQAAKLGELLPKPRFTLGWDENSIPENLRPQIDEQRDLMIEAWKQIRNLEITVAPSGDLNIKFGKELPKDGGGLPIASELEFGENPRLNVTIDLERGTPAQSIIAYDAYMEIGHAIGAYLGVADDALPGNCMYRNNRPAMRVYGPNRADLIVVSHNLTISDQLRGEIKDQKPVAVEMPHMVLTYGKTDVGAVRQGLKVPLDFKIKNTGTGLLGYNLVPDCGCFTKPPPGAVGPGQEVTIRTIMNTSEYIGYKEKLLVLYTNDPTDPVHSIPVSFRSSPACRLYRPQGENVDLPAPDNTIDILLTLPSDSKIVPEQYEWSGMDGKLSMEKWSGTAPDPDLDEPPQPRHGYIFHVKVGKNQIQGRTSGTLNVTTNDEEFPQLTYTIYAQKGILALPEELFFGEVTGVARNNFEVSRPGKPFKILAIEVGAKSLKATVTPITGFDYRIDVNLDGTVTPKGDFASYVKVRTSDPAQPTVTVSVRGNVQ